MIAHGMPINFLHFAYTTGYVGLGHQRRWPYQDTTGWPSVIATYQNDPQNLAIYATGFNFVSFWDSGDFYGTVYAPRRSHLPPAVWFSPGREHLRLLGVYADLV